MLAGSASAAAQVIKYDAGQNIVPVFEGWQRTPDGNYKFHFGYLNRNYQEILDVPVGPNNKFDPAPLDRDQPTHFYARRQRFVFTVDVPKDWDKNRRLVWTLVVNGKTETANGWLQPEWEVDDGVIQMNIGPGGAPPNPPNHYPQVTGGQQGTDGGGQHAGHAQRPGDRRRHRRNRASRDRTRRRRRRRPASRCVGCTTAARARCSSASSKANRSTARLSTNRRRRRFDSPGTYVVRALVTDGLLQTTYDILIHAK